MLEQLWGSKKFLKFYLICGAMGGLLYTFLVLVNFPYVSIGILIGASGAIYGMLAAGAILFPRMRVYVFGIFPIQMMYLVMILFAFSVINIRTGVNPGGETAHLAGMAAGAVYVLWTPWREKTKQNFQRSTWQSKINQQRVFQQEVDRILDKISKSGIASLNRKEKKILKEASQRQQQGKY
jgi:membrane associated rhomboid family serine protease